METQTQKQEAERKLSSLQAMAANYGKTFEPNLLRLWMRLLAPYSAATVETAVVTLIETRPYPTMPTYADLRRYLPGVKALAAEDVSGLKAQQEFDQLWELIRSHGSHHEPALQVTTAAVVRSLGGWQTICETWKESDRHWKSQEFVRLWQTYEDREDMLGAGALGVDQRQALAAPKTPAPVRPVPAGVCPECHGSGWITAWREGKLTSSAFACRCNEFWTGRRYTREELAADGWVFTEPKREKTMKVVPHKADRERFPGLRKDFRERVARMEIEALRQAGQTRLADEKEALCVS